jgi:very-short-patch-repair endonuclease
MPDNTARLLEYLAALTKLSSKNVYSLDEYERVFWLHSLPRESPLCFCRAWKTEEQSNDLWLTIKKAPPQTAAPLPPDDCVLWLEQDALADCKEPPELEQSVTTLDRTADNAARTLHLIDFPAVHEQWQNYLADQWQPWAEECRLHDAVRRVYKELFLLHQELQKSGEQCELVLGLGLLRWRNSSGQDIKRHMAAAGVSLVFEAEKGLFTVRQDSDKAEIELDMLDEQPLDARSLIDEGRAAVSAAAYDRAGLDAVLRKIAHSLGAAGQGEYHPDRLEPAPQPGKDKPLLEYAPALILRKRGQRGLDQLLTELKAQPVAALTEGFRQLCGILSDEERLSGKPAQQPGELYFPLPANEEQRKIIRALDMQAGVLVQGPPGTGKSHTIANLISHLLATGKRILVTAKTRQALQVLHDKLPEELRPLAISLLGDDKSSLARSVEGILAKWNVWDEAESRRRTDELEARLYAGRKAKAAAEQQILALREQETFTHHLAGGRCSGTAAQIARQLRSDADKYAWLADSVAPDAPLPLPPKEAAFLCQYLAAVSPADEAELTLQLPASEQVPPVSKVEAAFQKEAAAKEKAGCGTGAVLLQAATADKARSLQQHAQDMAADFRSLRQKPMPWLNKAADDALSGQSRVWQELLKLSRESVSGLEELAAKSSQLSVEIPPEADRTKLLQAAAALHNKQCQAGEEESCIAGGRYSGTMAQLARRICQDAEKYAWFSDIIPPDAPLPLPPKGSNFLCQYFSALVPSEEKELELKLPALELLPSADSMEEFFRTEAAAKEKAAPGAERLKNGLGATVLRSAEKEAVKLAALLQQAEELMKAFRILKQKPMPWLEKATHEILSGQDRVWRELLNLSQESISGLDVLTGKIRAAAIDIPPDIDRNMLLAAARELHEHFKTGGTAGRWIFKPEAVRKHGGLVSKVKADGQDCLAPEPLEKLLAWLTVEQKLNYAWSLWQGRAECSSGPFHFQLIELDELHKGLENALHLTSRKEQVQTAAEACGLELREWNEGVMQELTEDCRAVLAWQDYCQIRKRINQLQERFAELAKDVKTHPLAGKLAASIAERDAADYARLYEGLDVLAKKAKRMQAKQQLIAALAQNAPVLAAGLNNGEEPQIWAERLAELEQAWAWAQASSWLCNFLQFDLLRQGSAVGKVKVNGGDCFSLDTLEQLLAWLRAEEKLDCAWSLWEGKAERGSGPFRLQLIELDEMRKALKNVLQLRQRQEQVRTAAEACGLNLEQWTEAALLSLAEDCRAALAQLHLDQISSSINQLCSRFAGLAENPQAHPLAGQLAVSIKERNAAVYARLSEKLSSLHAKRQKMQVKQQLVAKLAETAPVLAAELNSGHDWQLWAKRLAMLEDAWAWAQASSWLKDFLQTDLAALLRQSQRLEEEIQRDLSKLAAEKAWSCCFERMGETHRQYLVAWQLSMKKIGKGTGKYADANRRNAKKNLSQCRDAVPAWIMPLHQVYETVNAGSGLFDVIIIDEASQCGPEALPLLQLGKRLIVVGDDKQVSPEAVGIDQAQVQQLMRTWLDGFVHADSFGPDTSLFDHCRIRFQNRISLREHFRCMPEIIRFSSELCYTDNPLIPLRRYLPDRLEPLQSVLVKTGYREGNGQRVINRPEAEAISEKVKQCCADERYQGKSMGVIVLQGTAQADLIQGLLVEAIGAEEMQKRRIICGNPPSFQGDERDVIFLSMVAAPNAKFTSMTGLKYEQRFNVAASRAKDQLWFFHSVTVNDLGGNCLRRRLLEHFQNPEAGIDRIQGLNIEELRLAAHQADRKTEFAPKPFDSWFEVDVALQIAGRGYSFVPQYEFAGRRIDLVIQGKQAQLAVECDGDYWHGPERYEADLARQRQLERCGWQFFRIRECLYYADADKALAPLWPLLERMGIAPIEERPCPD